MTRTTPWRIFRSANPMQSGGPIQPMERTEALAWAITRDRHPQYYRKGTQ